MTKTKQSRTFQSWRGHMQNEGSNLSARGAQQLAGQQRGSKRRQQNESGEHEVLN